MRNRPAPFLGAGFGEEIKTEGYFERNILNIAIINIYPKIFACRT